MAIRGRTLDLFPETSRTGPGASRSADAGALLAVPDPRLSLAPEQAEQLWLAVNFPSLPLEVLPQGRNSSARQVLVVVECVDRRQQVIACNQAAVDRGITPGMSVTAAHALVEGLQVQLRQPGKEQACLRRLAIRASRFSPKVSLAPPDGLLLEVGGSLNLFGGAAALCASLLGEMNRQRITVLLALAPTSRTALWLAQGGKQEKVTSAAGLRNALAGLPLAATRWAEPVIQLLEAMGIRSVGDCLRLPRDALARRIGPRYLLELDQAAGRAAEVRRDVLQQRRFHAVLHLEEEIEDTPRLTQKIEPLLERLVKFLTLRQAAIQALELTLHHRSREPTREILRFVAPVTRVGPVLEMLQEQLARKSLPAPVRSLSLCSGPLFAFRAAPGRMQFAAPGGFHECDPEAIPRLLEKLRARLGEDACYRLQAVADHRPEKAWKKSIDPCEITGTRATASNRCRPLWLLDPPERLRERQGWPWHRGTLVIERGPERIESGWWDGQDVARDYYVASSVSGARLWIYRDRQPPHAWFLHGFLD